MQEIEKPQGNDIKIIPKSKGMVWLENYWYHYKWHTIVVSFFALLFLFIFIQCQNTRPNDTVVTYCGPINFLSEEKTEGVRDVFQHVMPEDFDGNGDKYVEFVRYQVYSEQELQADLEQNDGHSSINLAYNNQQVKAFNDFMMTGESSVYLLSPYMYEYILPRGNLQKLSEVLEHIPSSAYDEYAVRLGDTPLYAQESALQILPEDTLVCLTVPYAIGSSSNAETYSNSVAMFCALVAE